MIAGIHFQNCWFLTAEKCWFYSTAYKYMMGGCVVKYFPEAYDFSEQEMNRIIACAFSLKDVKNMINTVLKERPDPAVSNDEEEDENDDFDFDETEENDPEESDDDEGGEA